MEPHSKQPQNTAQTYGFQQAPPAYEQHQGFTQQQGISHGQTYHIAQGHSVPQAPQVVTGINQYLINVRKILIF